MLLPHRLEFGACFTPRSRLVCLLSSEGLYLSLSPLKL